MKRKIILSVVGAVVVLAALLAYVAIPVSKEVNAARSVLDGSVQDVDDAAVERAETHLEKARSKLRSIPARVLRLVPVVGSNLRAVDRTTEAMLPVLAHAGDLRSTVDEAREGNLVSDGKISLSSVGRIANSLKTQLRELDELERVVAKGRTGSLAPPVWDALDDLLQRVRELRTDGHQLEELLDRIGPLLGSERSRTYLVVLINNSELRGAGGVLSGAGTLTTRGGRLSLGRLYPREALGERPYKKVSAPEEYERRFGLYKANTTMWINASYSADVPDVALVASRLFELVKRTKTSGAILVDPRGLSGLMPKDSEVIIPGTREKLSADDVPRFVYSDAYELYTNQRRRRAGILEVGKRAFEVILKDGFESEAALARAGKAIGGGHIRFVSFDLEESKVLDALGVSGNLEPTESDSLLVTSQNFGGGGSEGTKLDYWTERHVAHSCSVDVDGSGDCTTSVKLTNTVPDGLSRYVARSPYGLLRSYVDVFVPATAKIAAVAVDGKPNEFRPEAQAGRTAVGVYVEVPQGSDTTISVDYELAGNAEGYSLEALPQPLARDASMEIRLELPSDWVVRGPGRRGDGTWSYEGAFDRALSITAGPDERSGIPALWDSVIDFWKQPLFN